MANCCGWDMMVVGKDKASLDRLLKILKYEDKEFYLYRVFDAYVNTKPRKRGDYYVARYYGDVAWSADPWVNATPNPDEKNDRGASYTNLREICKTLGIGVEIWTEEPGVGFQQHIIIDSRGEVGVDDSEDWTDGYEDEDGEEVEEEGGFADYGEFSHPDEIYECEYCG